MRSATKSHLPEIPHATRKTFAAKSFSVIGLEYGTTYHINLET